MKRRALVITRTPVFGDQVVQALELESRFRARAFEDFSAALKDGQSEPFDLAVLDADAADQPLEQAARALRRVCPASALILVPPGNWVSSALVNRIAPDGMLTKPLSLSDLTDLLDEISQRFFADDGQVPWQPPLDDIPAGTPEAPPPADQTIVDRIVEKTSQPENQVTPVWLAPPPSSGNVKAASQEGRGLVVIRKGAARDPDSSSHGWLYDVSRAAQYLARLSMETSAQAALIVRGGKIWAYAGQVSQEDAQELAQVVTSQWNRPEQTTAGVRSTLGRSAPQQADRRDLIRFIRLANEQEFILYATGLVDNLALALAFDAGIPFRMIRSQAMQLAHALSQPPEANHTLQNGDQDPGAQAGISRQPPAALSLEPVALPGSAGPAHAAADLPANSIPDTAHTPSLLMDVPPSNPGRGSSSAPGAASEPPFRPAGPGQESSQSSDRQAGAPSAHRSGLDGFTMPAGLPISPAILHTGRPDLDSPDETAAPPPLLHNPFSNLTSLNPLENASIGLEPVTPSLSGLMYTCVMVPRIPTHAINGDLAARLAEWMPLLCLAYGWRLEKLEQRKEYLAWVVRVQLDTSPSYLMRILRQKTSLRIFADFPVLARENPSGDFWAPGYLILSSGALPSPDVIRSFIKQTRFYQGGTGPIILSSTR